MNSILFCSDGSNNFLRPLDVLAGDQFLLFVNNFSQTGNGFELTFGGTAEINCVLSETIDFSMMPRPVVKVYPTVTYGQPVNVELTDPSWEDAILTLYDSQGRVINEGLNGDSQRIDVSTFPKGVYHLILFSEGQTAEQRFIRL